MEVGLDRNQIKRKGHSGKRTWHKANGALKLLCYEEYRNTENSGQEHIRDSALGQNLSQTLPLAQLQFMREKYHQSTSSGRTITQISFLLVCPKPADPTPTLRTVINRGQLFSKGPDSKYFSFANHAHVQAKRSPVSSVCTSMCTLCT